MASHTYDPLSTGHPPSPHQDALPLHSSSPAPEHDLGAGSGYNTPGYPTIRPVPPNIDDSPPPGEGQRFYGALDDPYNRSSFASSSTTVYGTPRPPLAGAGAGYRDSDYDSVARLHVDSGATSYDSPRASSYGTYRDDPDTLHEQMPMDNYVKDQGFVSQDKRDLYAAPAEKRSRLGRKLLILLGLLIAAVIIIGVAIYFGVFRKKSSNNSSSGDSKDENSSSASPSSTASSSPTANLVVTGGDGSEITTDDGSKFTYNNSLGGTWYFDPSNPFKNAAQAQSYTPPLNQSWRWGQDRIFGVNIGGWLVTEPFISPALYQKYMDAPIRAIDEWTLSENMINDTAGGGLSQMEDHYKTFITEKDFAEIAGAGLNWVRIPLGFWAVSKLDSEPFLEGVSWKYFLKAIEWARKYGLRINLDLHGIPGSQNAFNHSGKTGIINWLHGVMGIANAQRSLEVIRSITEFVSQPQYSDVVQMIGLINEPQLSAIGQDVIGHFYYQAHNMVRNITGYGKGKGPYISMHDGFLTDDKYAGYLAGSDRILLDYHPYFAFQKQEGLPPDEQALRPCKAWGLPINTSMNAFGYTLAGEWSLGYSDCSLYLNNIGDGPNGTGIGYRYEGNYKKAGDDFSGPYVGNCTTLIDWENWDDTYKKGLKQYAMASMDATGSSFFWTWVIGPSAWSGKVESPHWSYKLGIEQGWIPKDPRQAIGWCAAHGVNQPIASSFSAWQTGGAGAGTIAPAQVSLYGQWPPASMSGISVAVSQLPTYTQTGTPVTLAAPTFTKVDKTASATVDVGNGWYAPSDTASAYTAISGCSYPDAWNAVTAAVPTNCGSGGGARRRDAEESSQSQTKPSVPVITPPPKPLPRGQR